MAPLRNVYACLVHERLDCVVDLVRNLRHFDPVSPILLYDGGTDPSLLNGSFPFERLGAVVHPAPHPAEWGRLHGFALDCMRFALQSLPFDTLTIVDSDQLAVRAGYTARLELAIAGRPRAGVLGSTAFVQPPHAATPPALSAFREFELWRPFLRRFPDGEDQFVRWSFWPSTVFTAEAARALDTLFARDTQLQEICALSQIWATEEVIFPTLVALVGLEVIQNPCSYEFVTFRTPYAPSHGAVALSRPDVFWMHPVPRRYDDALRAFIRTRHGHYRNRAEAPRAAVTDEPPLVRTLPALDAMSKIEGWLEADEADLLLRAAVRSLERSPAAAVVEVGSYCGRATVLLGHAVRASRAAATVYAIDPHDGRVGAADQGIQCYGPNLDRFERNIAAAGVAEVVRSICARSVEVEWQQPIGFLVIDGLHDYVNVARDFFHFARWLSPSGYVAFHDCADYFPGVRALVDELLACGDYELVGSVRSLVVLRRAGVSATMAAEARHAMTLPVVQPAVVHDSKRSRRRTRRAAAADPNAPATA